MSNDYRTCPIFMLDVDIIGKENTEKHDTTDNVNPMTVDVSHNTDDGTENNTHDTDPPSRNVNIQASHSARECREFSQS